MNPINLEEKRRMRTLKSSCCALSIGVAAILLCACGGASIPMRATNAAISDAGSSNSETFHYTGKKQKFVVPSGVTQLTVVARGAEGGGVAYYPSTNVPGLGGRVYAVIPVHPRERLFVLVGGSGADGGFNGGGTGGTSEFGHYAAGNTGGGASDVRKGSDALANRIIVAGGGGGAGVAVYTYGTDYGGKGGGLTGQSGGGGGSQESGGGGGGGTQSYGGSGGAGGGYQYRFYYPGQPGAGGESGLGGNGGDSAAYFYGGGGGGGGGGYYGGGGGGGGGIVDYGSRYETSQGGGGGGGSSYVEPGAITSRTWTGWKNANGDGQVVFSWK